MNPATTEIYALSLHAALPIFVQDEAGVEGALAAVQAVHDLLGAGHLRDPLRVDEARRLDARGAGGGGAGAQVRSGEHTSELQSRQYLGCRLLLEKKKTTTHPL